MNLKEIKELLNKENTIYTELGGHELVTDNESYVMETENGFVADTLESNDLSYLDEKHNQPTEILGLMEVAEKLGMTRAGVNYAIKNNSFKKVPKPLFYSNIKDGKRYFWLESQFSK